MVSRDTAPSDEDAREYELGDLELAPRPSQAQSIKRPPIARDDEHDELPTLARFSASLPANDLDFEIDRGSLPSPDDRVNGLYDDAHEGPALELDLPQPPVRASFPRPSSPSASEPSPERSSLPAMPARDPEQAARMLARFGDAPRGFLGAGRYLVRVAARLWTLHHERGALEARASERADAYERALGELGRALLNDDSVRAHEGLREPVSAVEAQQRALAEVEATTRDERDREQRALEALQATRSALESELAPYVEAEQRAEAALRALETELKRKEAQRKRADIELRALAKASIAPPAEKRESLESERERRDDELAALGAQLAECQAALGRARREHMLKRGGLTALEREQAQRSAQARALHGRLDADVSAAEHALGKALCSLAEAADKLAVPHAAGDEVRAVRSSERELDALVDELACYDRALALYDRPALLRGALVYALGALTLALLFRAL